MSPILNATKLKKTYTSGTQQIYAVNGVDFKICTGDFIVIIGPSGCGKSTLLRLLGLLDTPDSGDIEINGEKINYTNEAEILRLRREKIGFVFQSFNLLPTLTAKENIQLKLLLNQKKDGNKANTLLDTVGLLDRSDHYTAELSGGEMQRIAICRAIANDPLYILADEPTGNLDSVNTLNVFNLLKEISLKGAPIVLATHSLEATQFATSVYRLKDGILHAE